MLSALKAVFLEPIIHFLASSFNTLVFYLIFLSIRRLPFYRLRISFSIVFLLSSLSLRKVALSIGSKILLSLLIKGGGWK